MSDRTPINKDQRCTDEFLKSLPIKSISDLYVGFGCGALFWLEFNHGFKDGSLSVYDSAGTIQDYFTYLY